VLNISRVRRYTSAQRQLCQRFSVSCVRVAAASGLLCTHDICGSDVTVEVRSSDSKLQRPFVTWHVTCRTGRRSCLLVCRGLCACKRPIAVGNSLRSLNASRAGTWGSSKQRGVVCVQVGVGACWRHTTRHLPRIHGRLCRVVGVSAHNSHLLREVAAP
jgi:hypothetical protein